MVWLANNWQGLMSVLATLLGVGVSVAQLLHKAAVAAQIQSIQDVVAKLGPPPSSGQ
jgi:hypothetical protein